MHSSMFAQCRLFLCDTVCAVACCFEARFPNKPSLVVTYCTVLLRTGFVLGTMQAVHCYSVPDAHAMFGVNNPNPICIELHLSPAPSLKCS